MGWGFFGRAETSLPGRCAVLLFTGVGEISSAAAGKLGTGGTEQEAPLKHTIDIQFPPGVRPAVTRPWLRKVAARVLEKEGLDSPVELSILLTSSEEVERLNREYRGQARPTDVLSFSLEEEDADLQGLPGEPRMLGEVVISYPHAVRQAADFGHSLQREVAFLLVHGILHLLGYDHERPDEEATMFARQEEILAGLGIKRESE